MQRKLIGALLILAVFYADAAAASTELRVFSREEAMGDYNLSKPRLFVENVGDTPVSDFIAKYYFTAESGASPKIEDWYTPASDAYIEALGGNEYAIVYDFDGVTLYPGEVTPNPGGNVVGLHYADWSQLDITNDYSNNQSSGFEENPNIVVTDRNGNVISGQTPKRFFVPFVNGAGPEDTPVMEMSDHGTTGIDIAYSFPGAAMKVIDVDGERFQLLNIDAFGKASVSGAPALPFRRFRVLLPDNADVTLDVTHIDATQKEHFNILPASTPVYDFIGAAGPEFEKDAAVYGTSALYPTAAVALESVETIRGKRIATVRINPLQVNAADNILIVNTNVAFSLDFDGGNGFEPTGSANTDTLINNIVLNPKFPAGSIETSIESDRGTLQIVTTNDFLDAANELALWKRQMGYDVVVTSQAAPWTNPNTVYAEVAAESPDYLLLLGDHDDVIYSYSDEDFLDLDNDGVREYHWVLASDILYSTDDAGQNDTVPDRAYGRISVETLDEALVAVRKIVDYEKSPVWDAAFYNTALGAAYFQDTDNGSVDGFADRRFAQTAWEMREYLVDELDYNVDFVLTRTDNGVTPTNWNNGIFGNGEALPDDFPALPWTGSGADISTSLNDGRFLAFHRDHGNVQLWGDPRFTVNDVNALTNGVELPVVLSLNCLTGKFIQDSFAEALIRHSGGGAVGVVAATELSSSGWNDGLAEGLLDAIWPDPGLVPLFPHNDDPTVGEHAAIVKMGDVLNQAKLRMVETWGDNAPANTGNELMTYFLFHWFGDPSMEIWTDLPEVQTMDAPDAVELGETSYVIENLSSGDAVATLTIDGDIVDRVNVEDGDATLHIPSGTPVGPMIITITATGYRPIVKTVYVTYPAAAPFFKTYLPNQTGAQEIYSRSVLQTNDRGYILVGDYEISNENTIWVLKTDGEGEVVWESYFDGMAFNVIETDDGGFLVGGVTNVVPHESPSPRNVKLIKLDIDGNLTWEREYHMGEVSIYHLTELFFKTVIEEIDGGYVVLSTIFESCPTVCSYTYDNAHLMRIDDNGDVLLETEFAGYDTHEGLDLDATSDGGYAVLAATELQNGMMVIKTDAAFNVEWAASLNGDIRKESKGSIRQTADGGYIAISTGQYMAKLDENGMISWIESLDDYTSPHYYATGSNQVIQTADGSYVIGATELTKMSASGNALWSSPLLVSAVDATFDGDYIVSGFHQAGTGFELIKVESNGTGSIDNFDFDFEVAGGPFEAGDPSAVTVTIPSGMDSVDGYLRLRAPSAQPYWSRLHAVTLSAGANTIAIPQIDIDDMPQGDIELILTLRVNYEIEAVTWGEKL